MIEQMLTSVLNGRSHDQGSQCPRPHCTLTMYGQEKEQPFQYARREGVEILGANKKNFGDFVDGPAAKHPPERAKRDEEVQGAGAERGRSGPTGKRRP